MAKPKNKFRGGYYFRRFKGSPRPDILEMETPERVVIPMRQGFGEEVKPSVKVGERVIAGQIIGKDDESVSTPVHATISGIVREIASISYRGRSMQAVVIDGDGSSESKTLSWANEDFEKLTREQIGDLLYITGVSGLGAAGMPTFKKSSPLQPDEVKYIVVAALQTNPFAISAMIWNEGKLDRFAMGIKILRKLYKDAPVYIGISSKEKEFANNLRPLLTGDGIHIALLKPKYPQEAPEILTETMTGAVVPYGGSCADVGAVVVDLPAVLAAYEAVALGKPMITRNVVLGGTGYKDNIVARLRIGTPLEKIIAKWGKPGAEIRYIFGNVLVGDQVEASTPVGREVGLIAALEEDRKRRFLFFMRPGFSSDSHSRLFVRNFLPCMTGHLETNVHGERRVCIQCSYCENVCPRPLLPQMLAKYCQKEMEEDAKQIRLFGCIECGLCTYVCPAKIPIMTDIQAGVARLREQQEKERQEKECQSAAAAE